jgi:L-alanine-DL-glutamate epimerase-like enolase superfamily enzyme
MFMPDRTAFRYFRGEKSGLARNTNNKNEDTNPSMRIIEVRDESVSIQSDIRNAFIDFSEMTASAVAILTDVERDGKRVIGYGFHSNGRYSQSGILRQRMIPRLLRASGDALLTKDHSNFDPHKAWRVMMANEKPGGHGERSVAVGTLDMALWDIVAKVEGKPLYRVLADRYRAGNADPDVYVYAAGGYYYPGKDLSQLRAEFQRYLDMGYTDVKMKIGGASLDEDLRRIEAALEVAGRGEALAVDANGRFDAATATKYSEALEPYGLKWYEEPGDPLDYDLLAQVARGSSTPIATGENLFSSQDSLNLIRYGGLNPERDFLQMDPALSYGLTEYLRILEILRENGWSWRRCIPHGGHQFSLHIAAGLGLGGNESYPGVFEPFGGFADGVPVENSRVRVPDAPGIGIECKANLMEVFARLAA